MITVRGGGSEGEDMSAREFQGNPSWTWLWAIWGVGIMPESEVVAHSRALSDGAQSMCFHQQATGWAAERRAHYVHWQRAGGILGQHTESTKATRREPEWSQWEVMGFQSSGSSGTKQRAGVRQTPMGRTGCVCGCGWRERPEAKTTELLSLTRVFPGNRELLELCEYINIKMGSLLKKIMNSIIWYFCESSVY